MPDIRNMILYEDEEVAVLRKPAGLAVESARITEPDLIHLIRTDRLSRGEKPEAYLVHRLDQPVEGIIVTALTKRAAANLSEQIRNGSMKKTYLAAVSRPDAAFRPDEADAAEEKAYTLTDYLLRDPRTNMSRVVPAGTPGAKKAVLNYRFAEDGVLSIRLLTGRHHQIRAQLAHAGMPIRGDRKYGGENAPRLMLCAAGLVFRHPKDGRVMTFEVTPDFLHRVR